MKQAAVGLVNGFEPPPRRPLKIFAFDPMLARLESTRVISIAVANEPLRPGPQGGRIEVLDYDGVNKCFYPAVDLDDARVLMRGGLDPAEADPRFHQQMVYAVTMKVIENFDFALGRRIGFRGRRLRLYPHAFLGRNAFFDFRMGAVLFGFFQAERDKQGPNLPGQTIFTCLSHDIIAHEVTHALVHRLRRHFREPSNPDVYAFHEGFADIVAIFQHFSFPGVLREEIQRTRTDLLSNHTPLAELASQFGYATGRGQALRTAAMDADPGQYEKLFEAHDRGSLLVAAIFEAFFLTYQRRIRDLLRIASGGTGRLPEGDLHPALVNRIANEAAATAQSTLTMCIRAFDYLPPVDITFGDFLRALVTADAEMAPRDIYGQRAVTVEAFRRRGIHPENVTSLAEVSLIWEQPDGRIPLFPTQLVQDLATAARQLGRLPSEQPQDRAAASGAGLAESDRATSAKYIYLLKRYARANARKLHLDPALPIDVAGFHSSFRVAPDGQLLVDIVAQFDQCDRSTTEELGGSPLRGGTTVIASADGAVRYVIAKPLVTGASGRIKRTEAKARRDRQFQFVAACDSRDPQAAWCSDARQFGNRMLRMHNFAALHSEVV
ncbi:MAG TPA: hypothetical protein VIB79_22330 [Candidatus Binatia bacterium]|jgi:hypothetical protein